jgi:hypothetical protein
VEVMLLLLAQAVVARVIACTSPTNCPKCLAGWFARQAAASQAPCYPLTNQPLEDLSLRPNRAVSSMVRGWQAAGLLE